MQLPRTLGEALTLAHGRIDAVDAKVLLREASGCAASTLIAFPERGLSTEAAQRFVDWFGRREAGEPVAHILGVREFYGHVFRVTPDTLIPRPETELLVELGLSLIGRSTQVSRMLDLGTGTGAIAISIALASETKVTAVDASAQRCLSLRTTRSASARSCAACMANWFEPIATETFDLIVSNPPYIADDDPHLSQGDVRFEPRSALSSGRDGLDDIRVIVRDAPRHLNAGGWLLVEHGYDQAQAVRGLLDAVGFQRSAILARPRRDRARQRWALLGLIRIAPVTKPA